MNQPLPTVQIMTENGPVLINKSDFDWNQHKPVNAADVADIPGGPAPEPDGGKAPENPVLTSGTGASAPTNAAPPPPPAGNAPTGAPVVDFNGLVVAGQGKKFILSDKSGNRYGDAVYDSAADATAALEKLKSTPPTNS